MVGGVLYFFFCISIVSFVDSAFSCCTCIINCTLYGFIYLYFDNDQVRHKYHLFVGNLYLWRVTIPFFIYRRISKKTENVQKSEKKTSGGDLFAGNFSSVANSFFFSKRGRM